MGQNVSKEEFAARAKKADKKISELKDEIAILKRQYDFLETQKKTIKSIDEKWTIRRKIMELMVKRSQATTPIDKLRKQYITQYSQEPSWGSKDYDLDYGTIEGDFSAVAFAAEMESTERS